MRSLSCFILLLLLLIFCLPAWSCAGQGQTDLKLIFARLQNTAAGTTSLASTLVQEKRLTFFDETLLSKGRFFYRSPDHLRWELFTPVSSGFVLRGQEGQRWNGLSKEVSSFAIASDPIMSIVAQQLFAWAKVDIAWLESRYRIELLSEQPVRLQLFPLDQGEAGFVEQLQILFSAENSYVELVEMFEPGGDKTLLHFEDVKLNQPLADDTFTVPTF